jgi:spore coat polysaccharide biosynthesis predicted glycosyltransferase SpsG/GNAT superfamily N-acetyltransferase
MKSVVVAEGSSALGSGHQVRSACLAWALAARGHDAILACRELPGSAHEWAWAGLRSEVYPGRFSIRDLIAEAVARHRPDFLMIDQREASPTDVEGVAQRVHVVVIDDRAEDDWPAARLVVNVAPVATPSCYPSASVALGLPYALVRPEFAAVSRSAGAHGVLVMLGATDAGGRLPVIVDRLLHSMPETVTVVATPAGGRHREAVRRLAATSAGRLRLLEGVDARTLASLMAGSRAALLSASSVALEAACVGVPFVAMTTARDQALLAESLRVAGVPVLDRSDSEAVTDRIEEVAGRGPSPAWRVDGRGAERLCERLEEPLAITGEVELKPAVWRDGALLLSWAQDPMTRQVSFARESITEEGHWRWLDAKLRDPEARLWIAKASATPRGMLRLERATEEATVSITVAPDQRGSGWGGRILAALDEWNRRTRFAGRLTAWIRPDNAASRALFLRAGYRFAGEGVQRGQVALRFEKVKA